MSKISPSTSGWFSLPQLTLFNLLTKLEFNNRLHFHKIQCKCRKCRINEETSHPLKASFEEHKKNHLQKTSKKGDDNLSEIKFLL